MENNLKNEISNLVKGKKNKDDGLLKLAKQQGYVKPNCKLPGQLVMCLIKSEGSACKGCNHTGCD
jgi:hypothetical protein